ncbi:MAG: hypothetical protein IPI67_33675 [Myxococcales bacterium]|nr:hypothetical protein [Myxococcales bacterium]
MRRVDLEHIIRAAAQIADDDEIIVIGSQAVLGQFPEAPAELLVSTEADVYPKNHPERWELIDGSIGELSPFHDTFGYYAQGVELGTATLPDGWEARLVPICNPNTRGATGLCLEIHDLLLSKYVAGRDKDGRFIRAAIGSGLADREELERRLVTLPVDEGARERIRAAVGADFAAVQ